MSDYISREAASADESKHKIKTPFAKIIVEGKAGDPYYSILYLDPADGECHIGFSSYYLDNVFGWLATKFEVTEPCADVEPVRRGEWLRTDDDWNSLVTIQCSAYGGEWCFEIDEDMPTLNYNYCPNCGAKMELEDENDETIDG